nr:uncharacterized protein LOC113822148 [Penaeus vannamei]
MVAGALLSLGLTIAFITVGAIYKDDCNVEPMIPIWLIVQGVFSLLLPLFGSSKESQPIIVSVLGVIVNLVASGWFIAGNVWVFRAWSKNPDFEDLTQENSCHKGLFHLALYGGLIGPYAALGLIVVTGICLCICS